MDLLILFALFTVSRIHNAARLKGYEPANPQAATPGEYARFMTQAIIPASFSSAGGLCLIALSLVLFGFDRGTETYDTVLLSFGVGASVSLVRTALAAARNDAIARAMGDPRLDPLNEVFRVLWVMPLVPLLTAIVV